jgi:hypothetical protein
MESYKSFQKSKAELAKIKRRGNVRAWDEFLKVAANMRHHSASTVVFGAMCLEAFIYDYAAHNISDRYTKKYLDKLDLVSKWVVIPKLVTGKEFPRQSQAFRLLKQLVKARNDLVHYKSRALPTKKEEWGKAIEEMEKEDEANTVNAYQAVKEVLTELRKLEGDAKENKWWSFRANRIGRF